MQAADRSLTPHGAVLRSKENRSFTPRDEQTADIRSYPKRLSPTVLSGEFYSNLTGSNHVLYQLIPPRRNTCYDLRPRDHDRLLTQKPNSTVDSDFIIRMLFKDSY